MGPTTSVPDATAATHSATGSPPSRAASPAGGLAVDELRARYEGYRRRQGARLLRMIPRDAVRPLHRRALAAATGATADDRDPLALLVEFCATLLPLPPFEVWCDDLRRNPVAHEEDLAAEGVGGPSADAPSTLDARGFTGGGVPWEARLRGFRDGATWRGFIAFRSSDGGPEHRTAPIFHEDGPSALRDRFRSFDHASLAAFLRSTLP